MASNTTQYTTAAVERWVASYHAASGSLDVIAWIDKFTSEPEPSIKFFAFPDLVGRPAILSVFKPFIDQLDFLHHEMVLTRYVAPHIFHKCTVSYLPKGGNKQRDMIVCDVMVLFKVQETVDDQGNPSFKCERMEAYGDPSALLEKIQVG